MLLSVRGLQTHLQLEDRTLAAVDGIDFDVDRGETFCLVGESGSGKSVTALSLVGLLPAGVATHPAGEARFDGTDTMGPVDLLRLDEADQRRIRGRRIAMIFQEPMTSLNPVFTVGEQLLEALSLYRPELDPPAAREAAIEALARVRIPEPQQRLDEYPHRLSGGQRQRVMIAMALAGSPELLIADEPTTALDVTVQAEILRLLEDLQKTTGMGLLFITHDFGVVAQIADRVAVMRHGRIVEQGPLKRVLREPIHAYTQRLLAAVPENLARRRSTRSSGSPGGQRTADPLVTIEDLAVYFPVRKGLLRRTVDHVRAVDGVDLTLARGEILALVGESGCGKTTLGRTILQLTRASRGRVRFDGTELNRLGRARLRPFRRRLQVVFQDPIASLNPRLNIATTLVEPLAVHGIGRDNEERLDRARATLDRVQLDPDTLWRYPHEFSGGQRQRIGIARALVLDPAFLVCDEITSALDVSVQAEVLELLLSLREERDLTLLFISHDIGVVEYVSDRTAVMYAGQIVEAGPTEQVTRAPRADYTQRLLAAVPRLAS
jgi:peptide/nickel transport system ATP-binding protein